MEKEKIEHYLRNSIVKGRLSPAYLFFGGSFEDKEKTALNFAKAIECEKENFPCNECESCLKIESFTHPDVKWLKGKGKISSLGIDELREIQKQMFFKPYQGKKKVYIFEVERLNEQTSNAFLKTLEEPPEYSHLILIAKSTREFLPTIVSRCQRIMFSSNRKVLGKEEQEIQRKLVGIVDSLSLQNPSGVFEAVEKIIDEDRIDSSLKLLLSFYRDLLVPSPQSSPAWKGSHPVDGKKEVGGGITSSRIIKIINLIVRTKTEIHQNANLKLSLEVMLMNILDVKGDMAKWQTR